jgi:two-component system OmpR family sensor kinase
VTRWRRWWAGRDAARPAGPRRPAALPGQLRGGGTATVFALNSFLLGQLDSQLPQNQQLAFFIESQVRGRSGPDGFGSRGPVGAAGALGAWISGGRLLGTDEEMRPGAKEVPLSPAARRILLRLPVNRQPYTRTLPGLGDYRLIAIPGQDADLHITGLPWPS